MTPERREKANRQCVVSALFLLVCSAANGFAAWSFFSWRAVSFMVAATATVAGVAVAVFLFWIATSVDAVPDGN
jgi:hypothetical protein